MMVLRLPSKLFRFGIPFIVLVVGGSFGLKEFTSLRFQFGNIHQRKYLKEISKEKGIHMKDPSELTLEAQFEKINEIDTTNWENKRGPRPWEENNVLYQESLERARKLDESRHSL